MTKKEQVQAFDDLEEKVKDLIQSIISISETPARPVELDDVKYVTEILITIVQDEFSIKVNPIDTDF